MNHLEESRQFVKGDIRDRRAMFRSDQGRGMPPPPVQKPAAPGAEIIDLPPPEPLPDTVAAGSASLPALVAGRRSRRRFTGGPVDVDRLSLLLWATQGVSDRDAGGGFPPGTFRTVPSAGARHPLETYLAVCRADGLAAGLYRYLPLQHGLVFVRDVDALPEKLTAGCLGQAFAGTAAVVFAWTALPARTEWRYGPLAGKLICLDAGHVCQNLYLACEYCGLGTCAIAAYDHGRIDALLGVDGREEFCVYLSPVGVPG